MFAIIGVVLVFACVITGFLMEKGKLGVLVQPAELVTIGGAAIGTVLSANPMHVLKKMISGVLGILKGSPYTKQRYTETLKMMFDLFSKSRKEGAIAIEADVEEPDKSPIFSKYPKFIHDHHVRDFVCDTMRIGHHRRRDAIRHRPDDGTRHGCASSHFDHAEHLVEYNGRCTAWSGHRGRCAGCGRHDGARLVALPKKSGTRWQRPW